MQRGFATLARMLLRVVWEEVLHLLLVDGRVLVPLVSPPDEDTEDPHGPPDEHDAPALLSQRHDSDWFENGCGDDQQNHLDFLGTIHFELLKFS